MSLLPGVKIAKLNTNDEDAYKKLLGWLLPDKFVRCAWGQHTYYANDFICENGLWDESYKFEEENFGCSSRDFLIEKRGIIINDIGTTGELYIIFKHKPNKFQKDYIIDLYIKYNDRENCKKFLEMID